MQQSAEVSLYELRQLFFAARDGASDALSVIDFAHHEVHEGNSYKADIVDISMGATEYIGIAFTTPAAEAGLVHIIMGYVSKASAHLELIESPGVLTGGAALTAFNRDRGNANTSNVIGLKSYDSTVGGHVITGGTVIHDLYTWASKQIGDRDRDSEEMILAPATTYAFKLTADEANGAGQLKLVWYEHVNRA